MTITLSKTQLAGLALILVALAVLLVPVGWLPNVGPSVPAPIPVDGLRVVFVEESESNPVWFSTLTGDPVLRNWLNDNCVKEPTGEPGWKIFDEDRDTKNDLPVYQQVLTRPRTSVPWYVVSNGRTGAEGPIGAGVQANDLIAIFSKYKVK